MTLALVMQHLMALGLGAGLIAIGVFFSLLISKVSDEFLEKLGEKWGVLVVLIGVCAFAHWLGQQILEVIGGV